MLFNLNQKMASLTAKWKCQGWAASSINKLRACGSTLICIIPVAVVKLGNSAAISWGASRLVEIVFSVYLLVSIEATNFKSAAITQKIARLSVFLATSSLMPFSQHPGWEDGTTWKSALNNMTAVHWLVATKVNIVEKKLLDPTKLHCSRFCLQLRQTDSYFKSNFLRYF